MKLKRVLIFAWMLVASSALIVGIDFYKAQAGFDRNNLMNDTVFENTSTMSAGDIDAFLNRYPNSCISTSRGFSSPSLTGYSPSTGFTYGGDVSAGNVIKTAADVYGLNPQVILTTLQKEQSLVTGNDGCTVRRYSAAMGNGCPDNIQEFSYSGFTLYSINGNPVTRVDSTCVNRESAVGFSRQIITATWKLKFWQERSRGHVNWAVVKPGWDNSDDPPTCYSHNMTEGWRQRCKDGPTNYYDGLYTIDNQTTHMDTGATAALYTYTPHFHGNQNFVSIFEDAFKFGSVHDGKLNIVHPDGTLVRPANSPKVYLLVNGKAQSTTSMGVFSSWGFDFGKVKIATRDDLNLLAATDADTSHTSNPAPLIYREGTIVKGSGPTIYVVQNVSGTNHKRSLDNLDNFFRLGYANEDIMTIGDAEIDQMPTDSPYGSSETTHPNGALIRGANDPTVYILINQERHSMTSLPVFISHGLNFARVKTATTADNALTVSWPVNWYGEGALVKGSGPTVYIIDASSGCPCNTNKRSFGTYWNFVGLDYRFQDVMTVPDSSLPVDGTQINS